MVIIFWDKDSKLDQRSTSICCVFFSMIQWWKHKFRLRNLPTAENMSLFFAIHLLRKMCDDLPDNIEKR